MTSNVNFLVLKDDGGFFCKDLYALLPNIEGQMRAVTMDSTEAEFDDATFKCAVPLSDGGTSICTLINKKSSKMEKIEDEIQHACAYIEDASLEYEIGTEEFRNRYPSKKARNVGRYDPRVDAVVILVKSKRDLDVFLQNYLLLRIPVIVGASSAPAYMEIKRCITSDVEKYKGVFMLIDASSSAGIVSTFIKRFFSRREILRAKNVGVQVKPRQRLRRRAERPSSWFTRFFFGATERSGKTNPIGRQTGLMAAPQNTTRNSISRGSKKSRLFKIHNRESIQSLAMAFVLVLGLGFIIIESRLPDANNVSSSSPRKAASSSKNPSFEVHKTYPPFVSSVSSEESESSFELHELFPSTRFIVLDSSASSPRENSNNDNRYSLARFVVSDALAPRNVKKPEQCAPIVRTPPTDGGAVYQTLDGKSPSGPPLVSAGTSVTHPDRMFIYAPPRAAKRNKGNPSIESMTLEFPCARDTSSRILKFTVTGRPPAKSSKRGGDPIFFETKNQAITSGANNRTIRNVRLSTESENVLRAKCKKSLCTLTVGALRGTINFSRNSRESASSTYGGVNSTFAPDGSAIATTGSLEVLKELLSGLEYTKATNMRKGEDVISITLTYDADEKRPTFSARAEQARVVVHVRAACSARTAKVAGNGVAKTGNAPGTLATIDVFCKDGLGKELKGTALRGGDGSQELALEVTHGSDVTQRMKFGVAPDGSCYRAQFVRPVSDYEVSVIIDGTKTPDSPRYVAIDYEIKNDDKGSLETLIKEETKTKKKTIFSEQQRPIIPARHSEDIHEAFQHIAAKEHGGSKWKAASKARNWRPTQVDVVIEEENNDDNVIIINEKVDDDAQEEELVRKSLKSFLERRNTARSESERVKMEDSIKKAKIPEGESKFMKLNGGAPIAKDMVVVETEEPTYIHELPRIPDWNEETIPRPENPTLNEDEEGVVQHGNGEYVHLHEGLLENDFKNDVEQQQQQQAFKASFKLDSSDGVFRFDRLDIEKVRRREKGHKHLGDDGHHHNKMLL